MKTVPTKTPLVVKKMFPNYVWDIATHDNIIYLTFDDGPTPEITNWTLDVLNQFNAKATFFCIGNNIEKHPDIFQDILNDQHAIGNHTQNHIKGWTTKTKDYLEDINKAQENIEKAHAVFQASLPKGDKKDSKLIPLNTVEMQNSELKNWNSKIRTPFRPPYGQIAPKQGKQLIDLGYKIIMWDVLSFDWDMRISKENCCQNVISKTKKGSIIVFHDSVKAAPNMQYTLPKVLEYFSKKGYVFKSLDS